MERFKNNKSKEQVLDELLRKYLLRCYSTISKQYLPIENMSPEQGIEHLFKLRNEGKIMISLDSVGELIECKINHISL